MRFGFWRAARLAAPVLLVGLAACQETGSVTALRGSPAGIPVALESIDGIPATAKTALTSELTAAASTRQVELAGASSSARYRVRGYVSKETTAEGTSLTFVWDVYDSEKRRAKRLTGSSPIRGSDVAALDKDTLAKLAAMSIDEIAEFLAESKSGPTVTADASSAGAGLLGFLPQ